MKLTNTVSNTVSNKVSSLLFIPTMLVIFLLIGFMNGAQALDKRHQVVIQVSTDDARTQKIAMNNAVNLQKLYGVDNVDIEIVAYGPGLGMLLDKSAHSSRVKSLALQDITFSACGNTMNKMEQKTGHKPVLSEGVGKVNAGVARIMELQEQGYSYVRP